MKEFYLKPKFFETIKSYSKDQFVKDIIAGLIFKIDELVIDNSVKHKLDDLSREIIKG